MDCSRELLASLAFLRGLATGTQWNRCSGMWTRRLQLNNERADAWWIAMKSCKLEAARKLGNGLAPSDGAWKAVRSEDLAWWFGSDETLATAVYAPLEGDAKGLFALFSTIPAQQAIEAATEVFTAFAYGTGGIVDTCFAVMDMRSALAETLATLTGGLDVQAVASVDFRDANGSTVATLMFVPHWSAWPTGTTLEALREAV